MLVSGNKVSPNFEKKHDREAIVHTYGHLYIRDE